MHRLSIQTLAVISAAYALLIVWGGDWWFAVYKSRAYDFQDEFVPRLVKTLFAFAPFAIYLAFARGRHRAGGPDAHRAIVRGWTTGFAASLAVHGFYLFLGLTQKGSGVNVGMAVVMLLSPVFLAGVMFVTLGIVGSRRGNL